MNNNNPPFFIRQRVVCVKDEYAYLVKDRVYEVLGINQIPCCKIWVVNVGIPHRMTNPDQNCPVCSKHVPLPDSGYYEYTSDNFAPIREVRDHKSIAVPEELLVIKDGDILEPSKILTQ